MAKARFQPCLLFFAPIWSCHSGVSLRTPWRTINVRSRVLVMVLISGMSGTYLTAQNWNTSATRHEIDNTVTRVFWTTALRPVHAWLRNPTPKLFISCENGGAEVGIDNGTAAAVENIEGTHSVRFRYDDAEPVTLQWGDSNDNKSLISLSPLHMLRELFSSTKVFYEFLPLNAPTRTETSFRVSGLKTMMSRFPECTPVLAKVAEQIARESAPKPCSVYYRDRTNVPERCKQAVEYFDELKKKCRPWFVNRGPTLGPLPGYTMPAECGIMQQSDYKGEEFTN